MDWISILLPAHISFVERDSDFKMRLLILLSQNLSRVSKLMISHAVDFKIPYIKAADDPSRIRTTLAIPDLAYVKSSNLG